MPRSRISAAPDRQGQSGSVSNYPWYFPDVLPTLSELAGVSEPISEVVNGISVVAELLGKTQAKRDYLFWEFRGTYAVRTGNWKAIGKPNAMRLYDLSTDIAEDHDLAGAKPEVVTKIAAIMKEAYREPRSQKDDGKYTGRPPKPKKK